VYCTTVLQPPFRPFDRYTVPVRTVARFVYAVAVVVRSKYSTCTVVGNTATLYSTGSLLLFHLAFFVSDYGITLLLLLYIASLNGDAISFFLTLCISSLIAIATMIISIADKLQHCNKIPKCG
jgi:hypothetical protein